MPGLPGQLLDLERVFGVRGIVAVDAVLGVELGVLADVFDVGGGFGGRRRTDEVCSSGR